MVNISAVLQDIKTGQKLAISVECKGQISSRKLLKNGENLYTKNSSNLTHFQLPEGAVGAQAVKRAKRHNFLVILV